MGRSPLGSRVGSTPKVLVEQVQDALTHLSDPVHLQSHSLARLAASGEPARPSNPGRALRQALEEAIEALKPATRTPEVSHAWRGHELLRLRYLEGLDVRSVVDRLAISRSEYYRDHRRAVEAVAVLLRQRWGVLEGGEAPAGASERGGVESAAAIRREQTGVSPPNNLPHSLTSFVGRERELTEVKRLLGTTRLLTLTGSGGSGKTRLALEVARGALDDYPDGVWLVELASLTNAALVPDAVAFTLDVHEQAGRPTLTALASRLRPRRLLLVLDNCEHLVDACASLAESLLRTCPTLTVMATSRQALGIAGEVTYRVPSLTLPNPDRLPPLAELVKWGAIGLFVERASAVSPSFQLTEQSGAAVARICSRLGGIPLAIELAAARAKVISVEQIASRLDDFFGLLIGGSRSALPRQQTLRGTLDWSYDLLTEPERTLFGRLGVFASGFTLEAAEGICGGQDISGSETLDLLDRLVDKSLVLVEVREPTARYRLLEPIRQYARERLVVSGSSTALRDRHRDWYLAVAERAEPELMAAKPIALNELVADYPNLRLALERCVEEHPEAGLRLAGALWQFWWQRASFGEGRRWLEAALARSPDSGESRAKALLGLAFLARFTEPVRARALTEESLSLFERSSDHFGAGWALHLLGMLEVFRGDLRVARAHLQNSSSVFREIGFAPGIGMNLRDLGVAALLEGDQDRARVLMEESLTIVRAIGGWQLAHSLMTLGALARDQGDLRRGKVLLEEALALNREHGSRFLTAITLCHLSYLARLEGDADRARALVEASLTEYRQIGGEVEGAAFYPFALWSYGLLAVERGDFDRGTRLLGAASASYSYDHLDHSLTEASLAAARSALDEESISRAWAEGQAMTLEQAVEHALGESAG